MTKCALLPSFVLSLGRQPRPDSLLPLTSTTVQHEPALKLLAECLLFRGKSAAFIADHFMKALLAYMLLRYIRFQIPFLNEFESQRPKFGAGYPLCYKGLQEFLSELPTY